MRSPAPVMLLGPQSIAELLSLDDCISAVEAAFVAHAQGKTIAPALLHVAAPRGEFHIKVGGLAGERTYVTTKIGGGFFNNRSRYDLPNIIGLIVLADGTTGAPLAVMESGYLTRLRTGAATAVAAKYLARPDSRTVTICGAGVQGEIQLRSLLKILPIQHAYLWSRTPKPEWAKRMSEDLNIDVHVAADLGAATRISDVIVTCTPAKRWYLGREHVRPGTFIAAVGTDSPDKQELEPALLACSSVVCDLIEQAVLVGDLHHAVSAGLMSRESMRGELGAVITGTAPKRNYTDEVIIFDSTGTALQDAAAAAQVYERAQAVGRGTSFPLWS